MRVESINVTNKFGLHARPCSLLVKTASKFRSEFKVKKDDMEINGKSIMGCMMLAAECGSKLLITVDGVDEDEALDEIMKLFEAKFSED